MRSPFVALVTCALAAAGCGSEPAAPRPPPDPVAVRIAPRHLARTPAGGTLLLAASAYDAEGDAVVLAPEAFHWTSTGSVSTTPRAISPSPHPTAVQVTAGSQGGAGWVFVEVEGAGRDSVPVDVFVPSEEVFRIELIYVEHLHQRWRSFLDAAARRWEATMAGELPEVELEVPEGACPTAEGEPPSPRLSGPERGVRIYVSTSGRFPQGTYVTAVGGPCVQRPLPAPTTLLGQVTINRDYPVDGIPDLRLRYVALHEIGHALGLVGLVQGRQPEWFDRERGTYRGTMALEGWRRLTGDLPDALLETGGHWIVDPPRNDVMSSRGCSECPITSVTIGGLLDLGYPAVWESAGEGWTIGR